jgi:glutamate synthase (NADPH) small chain
MAGQRMLKFVTVGRETPEKRLAAERAHDFGEIYRDYAGKRPLNRPRVAASAACPTARRIARCTTTSPTG